MESFTDDVKLTLFEKKVEGVFIRAPAVLEAVKINNFPAFYLIFFEKRAKMLQFWEQFNIKILKGN